MNHWSTGLKGMRELQMQQEMEKLMSIQGSLYQNMARFTAGLFLLETEQGVSAVCIACVAMWRAIHTIKISHSLYSSLVVKRARYTTSIVWRFKRPKLSCLSTN
eukprot:c25305_g2_i1 orf=1415-1726(+)